MSQMAGAGPLAVTPLGIPLSRTGMATSWVPDATPMYALHRDVGGWSLMVHGSAFGQALPIITPFLDQIFNGLVRKLEAPNRLGVLEAPGDLPQRKTFR